MRSVSIPIKPIGKPRMTRQDKWKQRAAVLRYRGFCDDLRDALPGYVLPGELHLVCFIEMPMSWSGKKRRGMLGAPHIVKPDADNIAKAFMDAFKTDDAHVYNLHIEKYWAVVSSIELDVADDQVFIDPLANLGGDDAESVPF